MKAAIVIGVDQVGGGLRKLSAAASGAREVGQWLERNDYSVTVFTDTSPDQKVARGAIFSAIQKLVDARNVTRLVIYFAGHGFLNGPIDECWLLSGAPGDPSEAINLTYSSSMARNANIPEVIFISDACRVTPQSGVHSGITGATIFPNQPQSGDPAEIDFYYGCCQSNRNSSPIGEIVAKSGQFSSRKILPLGQCSRASGFVSFAVN